MPAQDTPSAIAARQREEWDTDYERKNGNLPGRAGSEPPEFLITGSANDLLLEVAGCLEQPFELHRLVLEAWRRWPSVFGLPGATRESASDNKVKTLLYGSRGLIAGGRLRKVGKNLFAVAE